MLGAMRVESIFISDVHLGQSGCRATELLAFLAATEAKNIFVIGDLVDFWAMRRSVCWPEAHQDVLRMLVDRARSGTHVVYIPGNHDDAAREFAGMNICGDEFDSAVRCGRLRVRLGAALYGAALFVNNLIYRARRILGLPDWSLTAWLKQSVSDARTYIRLFEEAAARAAASENCDGVVCGHIHHPAIREIDGVLYCNDGDWVENCSSLVETMSGRLALLRWSDARAHSGAQRPLRLLGSSKA